MRLQSRHPQQETNRLVHFDEPAPRLDRQTSYGCHRVAVPRSYSLQGIGSDEHSTTPKRGRRLHQCPRMQSAQCGDEPPWHRLAGRVRRPLRNSPTVSTSQMFGHCRICRIDTGVPGGCGRLFPHRGSGVRPVQSENRAVVVEHLDQPESPHPDEGTPFGKQFCSDSGGVSHRVEGTDIIHQFSIITDPAGPGQPNRSGIGKRPSTGTTETNSSAQFQSADDEAIPAAFLRNHSAVARVASIISRLFSSMVTSLKHRSISLANRSAATIAAVVRLCQSWAGTSESPVSTPVSLTARGRSHH